MHTENTGPNTSHLSGAYELARPFLEVVGSDLTGSNGGAERVVSAWKYLESTTALDHNYDGEAADALAGHVGRDVGEDTAFKGIDEGNERSVFKTYIALANAYGGAHWPRDVLDDYFRLTQGFEQKKSKHVAEQIWENARLRYGHHKALPETFRTKKS
jgi:hypothetical protein